MAFRSSVEELAHILLRENGIGIIWALHRDACTLHRIGNTGCAAAFIEIADAAEREWAKRSGEARHCQTKATFQKTAAYRGRRGGRV